MRFQSGLNPSKKAFLVNPSTHTSSWLNHLQVSPKKKTPDDMRVSSEEESTDLPPIANRFKKPHTSKPTAKHNFLFKHFPERPEL